MFEVLQDKPTPRPFTHSHLGTLFGAVTSTKPDKERISHAQDLFKLAERSNSRINTANLLAQAPYDRYVALKSAMEQQWDNAGHGDDFKALTDEQLLGLIQAYSQLNGIHEIADEARSEIADVVSMAQTRSEQAFDLIAEETDRQFDCIFDELRAA